MVVHNVSAFQWPKDPAHIVRTFEQDHPAFGPPAMWAVWAVESLHYLYDLDGQAQRNYPLPVGGHHPDTVDIAHVRWATGTAITAIDLCGAALGRSFCNSGGGRELDLRSFQPRKYERSKVHRRIRRMVPNCLKKAIDKGFTAFHKRFPDQMTRKVEQRRAAIPVDALSWVDRVLSDLRYNDIHPARNRFTHSWLNRAVSRGGSGGHAERTEFTIRKKKQIGAQEIVDLSRGLATDGVVDFLKMIDNLAAT